MPLANANATIDLFRQALANLQYDAESFTLNGKAYTRFIAPSGGTWLTRDARITYPLLNATSHQVSTDKALAYELCKKNDIHIPKTISVNDLNSHRYELGGLLAQGPVVVKPSNSSLSWGVTLNVRTRESLEAAIAEAKQFSDTAIVQEQIDGEEVRFLVIDGESKAALLRRTPQVIGDGKQTIAQLVEAENQIRRKFTGVMAAYPQLDSKIIDFKQFDLAAVPGKGELVELSKSTMVRGGASMHNVINEIDNSYKRIAEKAARALSAQFIVVDIMIHDFKSPATHDNYAFIEFNTAPVLVLFYSCRSGPQFDAVAELVPRIDKAIKGKSV